MVILLKFSSMNAPQRFAPALFQLSKLCDVGNNDQCAFRIQPLLGVDAHGYLAVLFERYDVDAIFFAQVKLDQILAYPLILLGVFYPEEDTLTLYPND